MPVEAKQPVLILGGFLITQETYQPMATTLVDSQVLRSRVVPMSRLDWLMTSGPEGGGSAVLTVLMPWFGPCRSIPPPERSP